MKATTSLVQGAEDNVLEGPITAAEVAAVGHIVDPFASGYRCRQEGRKRRVRECYKGENKELWFAGFDAADEDIKDENEVKLARFRTASMPRRN